MLNEKNNKRIVLAGGPSTGKTSVLNEIKKLGFVLMRLLEIFCQIMV